MNTATSDELKDFVNNVLRSLVIQDSDLKKKSNKNESLAHRKIIDALCSEWSRQFRVYPQSDFEGYKIDFIGRQKELGRIMLAVEVDLYSNEKSWLKLADINAISKVWILLDYKWQARFNSDKARQQAWEDWLNGRHPKHTPEEYNKARNFWYSYGQDAGELTVFVKSPDFVGKRSISSEIEIDGNAREQLGNSFEIILQPSYIKDHYIYVPKNMNRLFPDKKTVIMLNSDVGSIKTMFYTYSKWGSWFQSLDLPKWFKAHPELKVGNKVRISVIKRKEIYRLEII